MYKKYACVYLQIIICIILYVYVNSWYRKQIVFDSVIFSWTDFTYEYSQFDTQELIYLLLFNGG